MCMRETEETTEGRAADQCLSWAGVSCKCDLSGSVPYMQQLQPNVCLACLESSRCLGWRSSADSSDWLSQRASLTLVQWCVGCPNTDQLHLSVVDHAAPSLCNYRPALYVFMRTLVWWAAAVLWHSCCRSGLFEPILEQCFFFFLLPKLNIFAAWTCKQSKPSNSCTASTYPSLSSLSFTYTHTDFIFLPFFHPPPLLFSLSSSSHSFLSSQE